MFDDFFIRALFAGIGIALITGPFGCFIIWRRFSFFAGTLAHSALLGVTMAVFFDINIAFAVFLISAALAIILLKLQKKTKLPNDALLGLLAHASLAVGFVILGFLTGMITEILGVQRGWIFGDYKYGNALGYKILGVPMLIGVNWALLTIITAAIAQQFYENLFMRIVIGVCLMIFLDLLIEPIAPVLDFWAFEGGNAPLQNYIDWTAVAIFLQSILDELEIIPLIANVLL